MIGSMPMMASPGYSSVAPMGGYAMPPQHPPFPGIPQYMSGPQSSSGAPSRPLTPQQDPPRRIVRAQQPDEPTPTRQMVSAPERPLALSIPSPEALGVSSCKLADAQPVDWTAVHARLDLLGATCFHLERFAQGGCRITCLLPTSQQGLTHRIDAQAATESDAVRLTLAKAEAWQAGR